MNDDLISKQELLNKLDELDQQELYLPCHFKEYVVDEVASAPQKTGWWAGTVCTACGESTSDYYNCDYCPRCGVKMEGEL